MSAPTSRPADPGSAAAPVDPIFALIERHSAAIAAFEAISEDD
jgi:hypothetical protein